MALPLCLILILFLSHMFYLIYKEVVNVDKIIIFLFNQVN